MFCGTKNRGTLISCKDFLSLQTCITMNAFNRSSIQNITHIFVYRNIKICTDFVDICIKLNTEQIWKCSVHLIWNTKFGTITASFGNGGMGGGEALNSNLYNNITMFEEKKSDFQKLLPKELFFCFHVSVFAMFLFWNFYSSFVSATTSPMRIITKIDTIPLAILTDRTERS